MTSVLVTGGAGYIGSHACKVLAQNGFTPVTFDNLITGWKDAIQFGPFEQGDLLDPDALKQAFARHKPAAVMHFAALSQVGEASKKPGLYWRNNVVGSLNLIEAAVEADCLNFVFSSTCATYGDQDGVTLDEESAQAPSNAYGASKRAIEDMLADFEQSHGLKHVVFRYFNVAGADPEIEIGEHHRPETHLIPVVLDAIDGKRNGLTVFGIDYDTPDGTCIRDYVHVMDLIDAHIAGLQWLLEGKQSEVFNLGTGTGFSVMDVINHSASVTNRHVPYEVGPRRDGDCTILVSGSQKAEKLLGWKPHRSTMPKMIADAWRWQQNGIYRE